MLQCFELGGTATRRLAVALTALIVAALVVLELWLDSRAERRERARRDVAVELLEAIAAQGVDSGNAIRAVEGRVAGLEARIVELAEELARLSPRAPTVR
jgi:uncharacterized protein YoaH (UPF0181 family)